MVLTAGATLAFAQSTPSPAPTAQPAASTAAAALPESVRSAFEPVARAKECLNDRVGDRPPPETWCRVGTGSQTPTFIVAGDAHALQLLGAFDQAADSAGRGGAFASATGCVPFLAIPAAGQAGRDCAALNMRVYQVIRDQKDVKDLYLVANWSQYSGLGAANTDPGTVEAIQRAFENAFATTLRAYDALGVRVHIIEQPPLQPLDPADAYRRAWREPARAAQVLDEVSVALPLHRAQQAYTSTEFRRPDLPARAVWNFDDLLCDTARCRIGSPERPYYADASRLSAMGAALLVPGLVKALQPAAR